MTRRDFLAGAALIVGCRPTPPASAPPAEPLITEDERARIGEEQQARQKLLAALEPYRVGTGESRRTPAAPLDLTSIIPELKPFLRPAVRLHPRFGPEPPPDAAKLGGQFLWPEDEPWPTDPATRLPLTPVLQLRDTVKSRDVSFHLGHDLLQLFWLARDPQGGELKAMVNWRRVIQHQGQKLQKSPDANYAFPSLVPVPCALHPEWVGELPDWERLRRTDLRARLDEWRPEVGSSLSTSDYFTRNLASAPGTKVGGWPRESLKTPNCKSCLRPLDYLLTVAAYEWTPADAARWRPTQEPDDELGRRAACGLGFSGGTAVEVYICRRCDNWPVRALVVS